jgi:hypothetical protein
MIVMIIIFLLPENGTNDVIINWGLLANRFQTCANL